VRVLLSAYACEPGKGSEPGIGWNWTRQIARFHEVWVITRANNRQAIETALSKEPIPNAHWVYFDLPRWARFWKKGRRGIHAYYYLWQVGAYFVARKLHEKIGFDIGHHVTIGNCWMPSFLALLPVPFVWGPVGGGEPLPRGFWRGLSVRGKVFEVLRVLAPAGSELTRFVRRTGKRSGLALATTSETEARLKAIGCGDVQICSNSNLPMEEICKLAGLPTHDGVPFRVMSISDLIHWKGTWLGLQAFAALHARVPDSEYWIVGNGPERERLQEQARALGIAEAVVFWGELPREEVLQKLGSCDVLLHPSLHDSGGWVCLEAMAAGRPVVCLSLGGPALQVIEETGIKVEAISPEQVVRDLEGAICRLAADPKLRARLGKAGRQRVIEHFNWDRKGEFLQGIYESVAAAPSGSKMARDWDWGMGREDTRSIQPGRE